MADSYYTYDPITQQYSSVVAGSAYVHQPYTGASGYAVAVAGAQPQPYDPYTLSNAAGVGGVPSQYSTAVQYASAQPVAETHYAATQFASLPQPANAQQYAVVAGQADNSSQYAIVAHGGGSQYTLIAQPQAVGTPYGHSATMVQAEASPYATIVAQSPYGAVDQTAAVQYGTVGAATHYGSGVGQPVVASQQQYAASAPAGSYGTYYSATANAGTAGQPVVYALSAPPAPAAYQPPAVTFQPAVAPAYSSSVQNAYRPASQPVQFANTTPYVRASQPQASAHSRLGPRPGSANRNGYQANSQPNKPNFNSNRQSTTSNVSSTVNYTPRQQQQQSHPTRQQQQQFKPNMKMGSSSSNSGNVPKHSTFETSRHKETKSVQPHYCTVCKFTCSGQRAFQEHLDSVGHKKQVLTNDSKAAQQSANAGTAGNSSKTLSAGGSSGSRLSCEICHVSCTSVDSYAAHVRSIEHQKMLKLHAGQSKSLSSSEETAAKSGDSNSGLDAKSGGDGKLVDLQDIDAIIHPDLQPIGLDMIEERSDDSDAVTGLYCNLCEREIPASVGKMQHGKTRGHRQQYKNKVDSKLIVESKPVRSLLDGLSVKPPQEFAAVRGRGMGIGGVMHRRMMAEQWRMAEERRFFEGHMMFMARHRPDFMMPRPFMPLFPPPLVPIPPFNRYVDHYNDQHVTAKHTKIYPSEAELEVVQSLVTTCEKCLKLISSDIKDSMLDETENTTENSSTESSAAESTTPNQQKPAPDDQIIKSVMRVGLVAKGLLLRGDNVVEVVALCATVPTKSLLGRIVDEFPKQLATFTTSDKYTIESREEQAAFTVTYSNEDNEQSATCIITLTSPLVREQLSSNGSSSEENKPKLDPDDSVLDQGSCLAALAAVRRAKWFQAKAIGLPCCLVIIRILRDLCKRDEDWKGLDDWIIELLVEKSLSSFGEAGPGDALLRVLETISSGILLPDARGLCDPCEKDPADATASLTNQQRENVTKSAQKLLRKMAFRQVYLVLGMSELETWSRRHKRSSTTPSDWPANKKRKAETATNEASSAEESEENIEKKDGEGEEEVKEDDVLDYERDESDVLLTKIEEVLDTEPELVLDTEKELEASPVDDINGGESGKADLNDADNDRLEPVKDEHCVDAELEDEGLEPLKPEFESLIENVEDEILD